MSILAEIFVASPHDAPNYERLRASGRLGGLFEVVHFKGLTNLEFGTLWAIIEGAEFDFERHAPPLLPSQSPTSDDSSWLFQFQDEYIKALATLDASGLTEVSTAWADTEELQWDPADCKEVLFELIRLARLARSTSKGMYCWGCV